nr:FecR family protein [uncultured Carboxylicivirga sp.]
MRSEKEIQDRFTILHKQFVEGNCSVSELEELDALMEEHESANSIKSQMHSELEKEEFVREGAFNKDGLFEKIKSEIDSQSGEKINKVRKLYINLTRVAAIIISFVLGGAAFYLIQNNFNKEVPVVKFSEIVTPLGAKTKVVLPDGSIVWVNAGSRLKYSNLFNESNRKILLEGEAYFKVAKNKDLPFVVDAYGFLVEAVGTEFNVKAYEEEETIVTSLVEGKVKLNHKTEKIAKNVYLNPNHRATFYKSDTQEKSKPRLVINTNVDLTPIIAWRDNQLILDKELLKDLAVKLERMYDCKFHFDADEIRNYEFTGSINNLTLNEIMDVIKISSPIKYNIKGNDVYVRRDEQRSRKFTKY